MVNDEYVPARAVALSSYRPAFLAAIDKALRLEIGERPQSIAQWREQLLAPEPKRDRGRLSLGRALERLRTGDPARSAAPRRPQGSTEPLLASRAPSPVPAPPDAPQPKGQLLDFIDALKKRRSGLAAKKAPARPRACRSPAPVSRQAAADAFGRAMDRHPRPSRARPCRPRQGARAPRR